MDATGSGLPEELSTAAVTASERLPIFQIEFDPATLDSSVTPLPTRGSQAQPPQGLTYDLDIEQFLNGDSFDLTGITVDDDGDFVFGFRHSHPFPAPDYSFAPSGKNRADLGYTGRLLILADRDTQAFFGNTIRLDTTLVKAPDGYVQPGDLLFGTGLNNNTFPFMLLVDEAADNREGISNQGQNSGNFLDGPAGWQQSNAGATNDGWTGFDFIHGGQSITNSFTLYASELGAGQISFAAAFLIKYTDPRGVGGASMRLPLATPDPLLFGYRLPFAALDLSQVAVTSTEHIIDIKQGDTMAISLMARDWDAFANEATDPNLSDETDLTLVPPGSAGVPLVEVDAPYLSATPQALTAYDGGIGQPGLELLLSGTITNQLGTSPIGTFPALIRLTDPEDAVDDSYHFGVDPTTILASSSRALKIATYVPLTITLEDVLSCPPTSLSFDFEANGYQGWIPGGLGLPNIDQEGWGGFSLGCDVDAAEAAYPGLTGKYLTTTNDDEGSSTSCAFPEDYGGNADYNIVSPILLIPELCGPQSASLSLSGGMWTRANSALNVYTSNNEGGDWTLQGTIEGAANSIAFSNHDIPLTGIASDDRLRVRIQFRDAATFANQPQAQDYLGAFLDSITLTVTSLSPITIKTDDACVIWKEDFEGATTGWTTYGLPQLDAAIAEGGACGAAGPWGGPSVCTVTSGLVFGRAMTFGGDGAACGSFPWDLAHTSNYNIVSPLIDLTDAVPGSELRLDDIIGSFEEFGNWTTIVYAAIDPATGAAGNWGTPLISNVHDTDEGTGSEALAVAIPPALLGAPNVRIRIQITTPPNTTGYSECPGAENICECNLAITYSQSDAFGVDNLRIGEFSACD